MIRIDAASLESMILYIDLAAFLGFGLFLLLGIVLVHIEHQVLKLTTTPAEEADRVGGDSHPFSGETQGSTTTVAEMVRMQWDDLSWDEKMQYQSRQFILNWAGAACGLVGIVAALFKFQAEQLEVPPYAGPFVVGVVGVLYLAMMGYWLWAQLRLEEATISQTELGMRGTSRARRFDRRVMIVVLAIVFGAVFGPGFGALVFVVALCVLVRAMTEKS